MGFSPVVAAQQEMGRTKNKKRRIPFHVESSLVPLRFWSFLWSLRRVYSRKSQEAPGENESLVKQIRHTSSFSINQRKFSAQKDQKTMALIGR